MPANNTPCRVFVIDDHPLMRAGLARVISLDEDLELVGERGTARGALDEVLRLRPDTILLDLSLKDSNGLELIKDLRAAGVDTPILVVSMHDESLYAERVLKAGGNGYLMKEEATDRLVEGIHTVMADEIFLSNEMNRMMLKRLAGRGKRGTVEPSVRQLTDREIEILELIGRGMPSRTIAENLGISPRTVGAHRSNIRDKLGFSTAAELVRYAVRWIDKESSTPSD